MKIIVLGAGVVGVTTAYDLAKAGHAVTLIDRHDAPAQETSFANAGHVSHHTAQSWAQPGVPAKVLRHPFKEDSPYLIRPRLDPRQWDFAARFLSNCTEAAYEDANRRLKQLSRYSVARLRALRDNEALVYDQADRGILSLFETRAELEAATEAAQAAGETRFKQLDWSGCIATEPALAQSQADFTGGLFHEDDETGDAHQFTIALAARARSLGVTFQLATELHKILVAADRVTGVATDRGRLDAEAVVVCLGSYSPFFVRPFGVRLPVYPMKGYSVTIDVKGANAAPMVGVQDGARKVYMSRLGDRLRVAGTGELAGYDTKLRRRRARAILDRALTLFPHCGDPAQARYWCGLRPMSPDCVPVIGQAGAGIGGLFLNTGHGSLGWTLACGSAALLTDLVSGRAPDIDPGDYRADRF